MTRRPIRWYAFLPLLLLSVTAAPGQDATDETPPDAGPNDLWLEEIEGDRALEWVRSQNERTEAALRTLPVYDSLRVDLRRMIQRSGERVPIPSIWGDYLYDFWRDAEHQRGLWRRTSPESFLSGDPEWEVLIDVDSLAAAEGEPWVFAGTECLPPEFLRCVVGLSRRGSDGSTATRPSDTVHVAPPTGE
ncbi:MAG: S9 family peptidase, partial [Gemmatimonadota bacterium]